MKNLIPALLFSLLSFTSCAQKNDNAPQEKITPEQWNEEAKTNIRLLPKYGYVTKNEGQKEADKAFITSTMQSYSSVRDASNNSIELGFDYLYRNDIKTAMYRFNQAFLLDSTNTDIYWGYGAVYFALDNIDAAKKQYTEGLAIDSNNTHLLTDYATCFIGDYYKMVETNQTKADKCIDTAILYLTKSYMIDNKDNNTTFKLSTCYLRKNDCTNARKYYNECMEAGGRPISDEFTQALNQMCK